MKIIFYLLSIILRQKLTLDGISDKLLTVLATLLINLLNLYQLMVVGSVWKTNCFCTTSNYIQWAEISWGTQEIGAVVFDLNKAFGSVPQEKLMVKSQQTVY